MIFEGSGGSICLFIDGKIIASAPLTRLKPLKLYQDVSNELLVDGLRSGKFNMHTAAFKTFQVVRERRDYNKKYTSKDDQTYIIYCGFMLHKLGIFHEDSDMNGLYISAPKRKNFRN